ncbi:MAG: hypothetical protein HZY78_10770 [Burkholderiaceae bacterium]|nr:MAG: hypothetical protein HZY78_10770 [Burkholderiaceae bacterium]
MVGVSPAGPPSPALRGAAVDLLELDDLVDLGAHGDVGHALEYAFHHHRHAVLRGHLLRLAQRALELLRVGHAQGLANAASIHAKHSSGTGCASAAAPARELTGPDFRKISKIPAPNGHSLLLN